MPFRTARSLMRGRPPLGDGGCLGSKGSTNARSSFERRGAAMAMVPGAGRCHFGDRPPRHVPDDAVLSVVLNTPRGPKRQRTAVPLDVDTGKVRRKDGDSVNPYARAPKGK